MQRQVELEGREKSDVLLIRVEQQWEVDGKVLVCDGKSDDQICTVCGIVAHGLVKRDSREREGEREKQQQQQQQKQGVWGGSWIEG